MLRQLVHFGGSGEYRTNRGVWGSIEQENGISLTSGWKSISSYDLLRMRKKSGASSRKNTTMQKGFSSIRSNLAALQRGNE
jgi:hypothetical protein